MKRKCFMKIKLKNKSDKHQSSIIITINNYDNSSSSNNNNNNNNNKTSTASFTTATIKLVLFMVQKHHIDSGRFGLLVSPPGTSSAPANGPGHARHRFHREVAPASIPGPRRLAEHRWPFTTLSFMGKSSTICNFTNISQSDEQHCTIELNIAYKINMFKATTRQRVTMLMRVQLKNNSTIQ